MKRPAPVREKKGISTFAKLFPDRKNNKRTYKVLIAMGFQVVMGASMLCSFGTAPGSLIVLPKNNVIAGVMPAANIMDYMPVVNIPPFAMCTSLANPAVASATTAAWGVLTPMPCTPATAAPWVPGAPTVLIGNMPALTDVSKCICSFGGTISIVSAGQVKTILP